MKVITIKQPWATLIAKGYKEYELRSWNTKYRGEIYIHAGNGVDKEAMKKFEHLNLEYPKGQIIAKANLADCIYITKEIGEKLYNKNKLLYGFLIKKDNFYVYAFKLENIKEIKPIKTNGNLGLWNYEPKKENI